MTIKPLAQMSESEMREWCETLRASREALRSEAIAAKQRREAMPRATRAPAAPDPDRAALLALLRGETQ